MMKIGIEKFRIEFVMMVWFSYFFCCYVVIMFSGSVMVMVMMMVIRFSVMVGLKWFLISFVIGLLEISDMLKLLCVILFSYRNNC